MPKRTFVRRRRHLGHRAFRLALLLMGWALSGIVVDDAAAVQRKPRVLQMEVTAYCACTECCGPNAQGITASGKNVYYNDGQFVAADKMLKFGTKLIIPGYAGSKPVEVTDRGGAIKGNKLDVYFHSHTEALKWGRQKLTVTVVE